MIDHDKVIKGLECCYVQTEDFPPLCEECPYRDDKIGSCEYYHDILSDALELLKADQAELIRQRDIISKYRKADAFLAAHGWEWDDG